MMSWGMDLTISSQKRIRDPFVFTDQMNSKRCSPALFGSLTAATAVLNFRP